MKQNVVYVSQVEEFEAGWGSRPDGYLAANTKRELEDGIRKIESGGSYKCFNRCSKPFIVIVTDKFANELDSCGSTFMWLNDREYKEMQA